MRAKLESSAFCGWRYRTCWILLWKLVTGKRNQDEQTTEKSLENLRCGRLFVNNFRPGLATVSVIWNPLTNYHIWSFRSTQPWFSFFLTFSTETTKNAIRQKQRQRGLNLMMFMREIFSRFLGNTIEFVNILQLRMPLLFQFSLSVEKKTIVVTTANCAVRM